MILSNLFIVKFIHLIFKLDNLLTDNICVNKSCYAGADCGDCLGQAAQHPQVHRGVGHVASMGLLSVKGEMKRKTRLKVGSVQLVEDFGID